MFEFAVPSWINYRADSYTTAKARAWRMRNIKGGLACVDRGKDCSVRQCVAVAHASVSPSIPLRSKRFIVSARMHRYRRRIHRAFRFFFLHSSFALFLPFFPRRARLSFFFPFYFPTIIILSNFAHSKRWRKFVEVTPRKMRRIPCRVKLRRRESGWLFIYIYSLRKMSAFPRRKHHRSVEHLLNSMCAVV